MTNRRAHFSPDVSNSYSSTLSLPRSVSPSPTPSSPSLLDSASYVEGDGDPSHFTRLSSALSSVRSRDPALSDRVLASSFLGLDRSMWSAAFNLCNVITGSGVIGLPYATRQCGLALALVLLFCMAACTLYSLHLLVAAAHALHRKRPVDLEDVLAYAFGRPGYYAGLAAVFCLDLGVCVALLIVVGDTLPPVLGYYLHGTYWGQWVGRTPVLLIAAFVGVLPPSCLRSLDSLWAVSLASVASVVTLTALVIARSFTSAAHATHGAEAAVEWVGQRPLAGFGSIAFVFVCHDVALPLYRGLRLRSPAAWGRVTRVSVGVAMAPVLVLSVVGYLCFLDFTASNVLNNFTLADHWMNGARLMLALSMGLTFPSNLLMCRHVLTQVLGGAAKGEGVSAASLHWLLTLGLFAFALGVALLVDDLGRVQSLVGSVCAVSLAFLIPSACAIRVAQLKERRPLWSPANAGAWLVAAVGTVVVTLALTNQITDMFTPASYMDIPSQVFAA